MACPAIIDFQLMPDNCEFRMPLARDFSTNKSQQILQKENNNIVTKNIKKNMCMFHPKGAPYIDRLYIT